MKLKIYQADAFTGKVFKGNPAAVCPLTEWLADDVLQQIAIENNLSETAYYVPVTGGYEIRWFTPGGEVDLCGHATLATAFVLHTEEGHSGAEIRFISPRSGELPVRVNDDLFTLNFPTDTITPLEPTKEFHTLTDKTPIAVYKGKSKYLMVVANEQEVATLIPNFTAIADLPTEGLIVTARGSKHDFVSRFFAPKLGVNEDPVTGSAHTLLVPYWAEKLNKTQLTAYQCSARGGSIGCQLLGDRVELQGSAVLYMRGEIYI